MTGQDTADLTAAQLEEVAQFERATLENADAPLGEGWDEIAPGVLQRVTPHDEGGTTTELHATGVDALAWLAENRWRPELAAVQRDLMHPQALSEAAADRLDAQQTMLLDKLAILDRWQVNDVSTLGLQAASCTATARASARPTTASVGAKASATARTCTSGRQGYASAVVEPPYSHQQDWAPPGSTASASKVAYGSGCSSAGWAEGYPEYDEEAYHC